MKKIYSTLLLILIISIISTTLFAQKRQNTYFLKNDGRQVKIRDSADFIRIIREPDSGMVNYELVEFYLNGNKKTLGYVSKFDPLVKEGTELVFYQNGKRKTVQNYVENYLDGTAMSYYENGNLKESRMYALEKNDLGKPMPSSYKVLQVADSLGKTFLDSTGTGLVDLTWPSGDKEYGFYLNGEKDKTWKEYSYKLKTEYEEIFENGKFISGTSKSETGKIVNYTEREKLPQFPTGLVGFGKFLSTTIRYPVNARTMGIQGRVLIGFNIETDGSLSGIKILQSPHIDLAEESLRVIKKSPKWIPGTLKGEPVKVSYIVPVNFTLQQFNRVTSY